MGKQVKLKDGSTVVIRPMSGEDLDASLRFFRALPDEDRLYLRVDVTKRPAVEMRLRAMKTEKVCRVVALSGDEIVADGALELEEEGWKQHVAELRLIVARSHRRRGLGMWMARELYMVASQKKVAEIIVKMMRPQVAARRIFYRLGFREQAVIPAYVTDRDGVRQDMVLMRCELEELWRKLEEEVTDLDWQRTR